MYKRQQYLALKLEKTLTAEGENAKDVILENYLNTINLGSGCYGVQTAAQTYFGKDAKDLTLSECAVLAAIPKAPTAYNPKNHPGTIDTNAFVYLSLSDRMPVARLTLTGNVLPGADEWGRYPYAMGKLRLKQNRMEFREVMSGKRASERILCGNSGEQSLRLTVLNLPCFVTFRTEPEVISPGSEADIIITIDASLIPVEKGDSFIFPVIIEGVSGQQADRTLSIKVNCIK